MPESLSRTTCPNHAPPNQSGRRCASLFSLEWEGVKAVVARGGLVSYRSVLDSPFVHVPHDALPVNVFRAGDLPDVWAHLAPKPLRLEGLVDGTNRRVTGKKLAKDTGPGHGGLQERRARREGGLHARRGAGEVDCGAA